MKFMTAREAAALVGVTEVRLQQRRTKGNGPPYVKCPNGAIRYRRTDLEDWIAERAFTRLHSPDLDPPECLEKKIRSWTRPK